MSAGMSNVGLITQWRSENSDVRITATVICEILDLSNLRYADLTGADLTGANLRYADLRGSGLRGADLSGANLRYADLTGANLRRCNLRDADLTGADLRRCNLRYAHLDGADLRGVEPLSIAAFATPSGRGWIAPTPDGWQVSIGCWKFHTLDDLRALVEAPDTEWPEARDEECERRRPVLRGLLAWLEAHATYYAKDVAQLRERWVAS